MSSLSSLHSSSQEDVEMKDAEPIKSVSATAVVTTPSVRPFPFPFPPYPQQYQLMNQLFETLEKGKGHIAVVESPTGTGKSLTLISACLYWLLEHHPRQVQLQSETAHVTSLATGRLLPDWVVQQTTAQEASLRAEKAAKEANIRALVAQQTKVLEERTRRAAAAEKRTASMMLNGDEDEEFLLDGQMDAASGRVPELSPAQELRLAALLEQQSADAELLHAPDTPMHHKIQLIYARVERTAEIKRLNLGQSIVQTEDEIGDLLAKMLRPDKPHRKPQILFASRTHSQLIQMVGEIKKLKYGKWEGDQPIRTKAASTTALSTILSPHQLANTFDPILSAKVISLGSRVNLCIRPEFAHLRKSEHSTRLNDACIDLQKKKSSALASGSKDKSSEGCQFLNPDALTLFHDHVLSKIHDLEELTAKGQQLHFCPYYGSRNSSPEADVILLPYASLLSEATRESLQIDLNDAIIVIDEAHNLHDTINDIYSCQLTFKQLRDSRQALKKYLDKFQTRLHAVNKSNVELLLKVCDAFLLALTHSHHEAQRQWKEEQERGSAFTSQFGASTKPLNDIFSDGAVDGIEQREKSQKLFNSIIVNGLLDKAAQQPQFQQSKHKSSYSLIKSITHFNASLGIADINYHHLEAWMVRSDICKKIKGYLDKRTKQDQELEVKLQAKFKQQHQTKQMNGGLFERNLDQKYESTTISPLTPVLEFIKALSNIEGDGRVCVDIKIDAITSQVHPESSLRFLMLNPSIHLLPLLKAARTIILAGGTMQPFDTFKYQLFPIIPSPAPPSKQVSITGATFPSSTSSSLEDTQERLHFFSCSHVIPPSHIQALILKSGPGLANKPERVFNFQSSLRGDYQRLDDLGATLVNLLNVIPQGVVVFFTSYSFAAQVFQYFATHANKDRKIYENEQTALLATTKTASPSRTSSVTSTTSSSTTPSTPLTWLERIRKKKVIFRDAQGASFEEVLDAYTKIIQQCSGGNGGATSAPISSSLTQSNPTSPSSTPSFTDATLQPGQTGAILFSVVGGKMSEGINFSDGLARSVIMVGLPYPNAHEPLMCEKLAYADREKKKREATMDITSATSTSSSSASQQLLLTLCMRAVNQSIGRAIRHARDYASIILLDERYLDSNVQNLLPKWIKTDAFLPSGVDFSAALVAIGKFFQELTTNANGGNSTYSLTASSNQSQTDATRKRKAEDQPTRPMAGR